HPPKRRKSIPRVQRCRVALVHDHKKQQDGDHATHSETLDNGSDRRNRSTIVPARSERSQRLIAPPHDLVCRVRETYRNLSAHERTRGSEFGGESRSAATREGRKPLQTNLVSRGQR